MVQRLTSEMKSLGLKVHQLELNRLSEWWKVGATQI